MHAPENQFKMTEITVIPQNPYFKQQR